MIRSIRKRHKFIWLALAVLLPILLVAAFALRHAEPVNNSIPTIERGGVSSEQ